MASSGELDLVKTTLGNYQERGVTDNTLRLTPFLKCLEGCGLKQYKHSTETSIWVKFCDKGLLFAYVLVKRKKVPINKIATDVIDAIAIAAATSKGVKNATAELDEVKKIAGDIRSKLAAKSGDAAVKAGKVDATTARLTDTSGYTGSHKERFDASGKGKGMEGRVDTAQNTGYVGNYKNADTYDKTHK